MHDLPKTFIAEYGHDAVTGEIVISISVAPENRVDYEEWLGLVSAYIHDHLDDELDLAMLGTTVLPVAIAGGVCTVLRYRGPYAGMRAAYHWLYGTWVMEAGYEVADAPLVEEYLNSPVDTAPGDLLIDIRTPLR